MDSVSEDAELAEHNQGKAADFHNLFIFLISIFLSCCQQGL